MRGQQLNPLRLVRQDQEHRVALGSWLHGFADAIARGDIAADACILIASQSDIHRVYINGYSRWEILEQAARDGVTEVFERKWRPSTTVGGKLLVEQESESPESRTERRAFLKQQERARREDYEAQHPFPCTCGDRFKSERGRTAHMRAAARRQWDKRHGIPEPAPIHRLEVIP